MGVQSQVNQLIGGVSAAVALASHAADNKEKEQEQGLLAKEQYHEASADLIRLAGESEEAGKELEEKRSISDALEAKKPGGKGNTKEALEQSRKAALSEKEAAQRAFAELQDRIEAKKAMMERAQMIMKRTGVGGKE